MLHVFYDEEPTDEADGHDESEGPARPGQRRDSTAAPPQQSPDVQRVRHAEPGPTSAACSSSASQQSRPVATHHLIKDLQRP